MKRLALVLFLVVLATAQEKLSPAAAAWWAHIEFLADGMQEGRASGSPGHKRAADYIAQQFRRAGLERIVPGTGGYQQEVEFLSRSLIEVDSFVELDGKPLTFGDDFILAKNGTSRDIVEAGIVFIGYGLHLPEANHDDLAGVNLKGKVAFFLSGAPKRIPGALAAHAQGVERWKALREAGAIGTITFANPRTSDIPWERAAAMRDRPSLQLAIPELQDGEGNRVSFSVSPAGAEKLLAGSGHTVASLLAKVEADAALPHFALPAKLRAKAVFRETKLGSQNVAGLKRGSDPALKNEYVVLSAHLDHLGKGFNGAMDNASGVASLIEIARGLRTKETKRSIIVLAVTGEENGLLGSKFFANRPPVSRSFLVADFNMDMFLPLVPLKGIMVLGLDESDLGDRFRRVSEAQGIPVAADREPLRRRFTRSDQYSFIRQGIPSLAFKFDAVPGTREDETMKNWTRNRYHGEKDDLAQPVEKEEAVRFNRILQAAIEDTANQPARPRWKDSSFFKRFAPAP
ncbi:MAG: M28 family peptidase [Bryobacteraceae bacterium]|nr:M28 family peptidase [Bryobacteraceae bacterium]